MKKYVQLGIGCAVSIVSVYLLARQIPLDAVRANLARATVLPLLLLVATVFGGLLTRSLRWQVYFRPDRRVPLSPLFATLSISYMASAILPFRAGELVRAVLLGERAQVSVTRVIATIVLEKLFDFLAIAVMLVLLLATTPLPLLAWAAATTISTVILVGFGVAVGIAVWREPVLALARAIQERLPVRLERRLPLASLVQQFATGLDSLRVGRLWWPMLGWTAAAWGLSIVSVWAAGRSLSVPLTLAQMAFMLVVTSTGQAVPSSPGYIGVYDAAAVLALTALGVEPAAALAVAVVTHVVSWASMLLIGLAAGWLGGYDAESFWRAVRMPAQPAGQVAEAPPLA